MIKISFITTVNHNVGDDFVREGLKYILRQYFKNEELVFESVHKHSPITSRHGFEWFRYLRLSGIADKLLPLSITKDRIVEADLIVQSGAPVYWCHDSIDSHCSENEWYAPLIRRRLSLNKKAKLLNIAAGTCQRYDSDGAEFLECQKDIDYIKEFFDASAITTLRDTLAEKVLNSIGLNAPVIPCSSIFAVDEYNLKPGEGDFVAVNFMKSGGHYTFGQTIDYSRWLSDLKKFYDEISRYEKVVFVCHNNDEVKEAARIAPGGNVFISNKYLDYMKLYANAKFGVVNRVHGAFMMASFGKPSIVIGNDTRARMAHEIGLESVFINDANYDFLMNQYSYLKAGADNFKERFRIIKDEAFNKYMEALSVL
jgi:hypothetical protein